MFLPVKHDNYLLFLHGKTSQEVCVVQQEWVAADGDFYSW